MRDAAGPGPDLSVVLVCATGRRNLHRTLAAIAGQTIARRIEVLIVTPDDDVAEAEARVLARLHGVRVFREPRIDNVDFAVGRTLREAAAPFVAAIEDHAFPDPDWAEAVLAQFQGDTVAVGSGLTAANPSSAIGWSNLLIAMGGFTEATPEGDIDWVQIHNCTYRKAALDALDGEIWPLFTRESDILRRLREAGGRFRFAPRARVRHLNPSRLRATARLRFSGGRLHASTRRAAEGWGWPKRIAYAAGGPLIPIVTYAKLRPRIFGRVPGVTERRHGPSVLLGLAFDAAGQVAAFLAGPGQSRERLARAELDRYAELNRADAAAFRPHRG